MLPTFITVALAAQAPVQSTTVSPWTPETVLTTIGFGVIAVLITLVGFLGKKQLDTIISTINSFSEKQIACRETLSDRFVGKPDFTALVQRTDRHESDLARHQVFFDCDQRRRDGQA